MPSLADHQSNSFTKVLLLGDAKSGKTGSLVSLVAAGYKLRILDFDNLLDFFKNQVLKTCPDKIDNVEFRTLRDKYKAGAEGSVVDGKPKAWLDSLKMLNEWKYDDINYGKPTDWGPDTILVIDSLSRWCDACYAHHLSIIPGAATGKFDGRAVYGNAQRDMEKQLAMLTSESFKVNVIVICHGIYLERDDGKTKIFPRGIGEKLSPNIPTYFPNYIRYVTEADKRLIHLKSDRMIDLSVSNPDLLGETLSVESGLAEFFEALRGQPSKKVETISRPKTVTLRKV